MNVFLKGHLETLEVLIKNDVRYLLIGGLAVNYYGYHRTTGDMDLWIDSSDKNKAKLIMSFEEMGFDIDDLKKLASFDFTKHTVFSIGQEPDKIDFITKVQIVDFVEAYKRKQQESIDNGLLIDFVHYRDLIVMKMNTGRLKDKADIEELQKIMKYRKK